MFLKSPNIFPQQQYSYGKSNKDKCKDRIIHYFNNFQSLCTPDSADYLKYPPLSDIAYASLKCGQ